MRRDMHRLAAIAVVALLGAAACSGGDDETYGGAEQLPGPVPAGVEFTDPPAGGVEAPDFTARLVDGTSLTASELWDDRPVVVVFTASWCEACRDVEEKVQEAVADHDGAVTTLSVVPADDAEGAADLANEEKVAHPVAVANEDIWLDWAAREPPVVVLVAPGGTVLRGWPGGVETDVLAEQLDGLIADG
jgi:thiol-disulfide isomerase/thioredoxin